MLVLRWPKRGATRTKRLKSSGKRATPPLGKRRDAFDAAVADGRLPARFDARFQGLWRYYLMYCEGGFRGGGIDVVQVTLVRE